MHYYASDMKRGSSLTYLGQTEMLDYELRNYGTSTSILLISQAVN